MPEQTVVPQALPASKPAVSAQEYLNRTDEELEAAIARPGAAQAARKGAVETAPPPEPKSEEPAPEAAAPLATDALAAATEAKPETEPEPAPEPKRELVTKFSVADKEGEVEIPLDLTFKYVANGKERIDPIDKVVKLAQMGVYNEEREAQVVAAKQFVAEAQQKQTEYERKLAEIDQQVDRFMRDEAFRAKAIELYNQQNSPESRAQRAEQQLQSERAQVAQEREAQRIVAFVQNDLSPRMTKLLAEHPTVSEQEIIGHYTMLTAPLLEAGRVPPQKFAEVVRLVDTDLRHWVEAKHEERTSQQQQREKKQADAVLETAKAKRMVARRSAPPSVSSAPQTKARKFTSASEWLNTALPTQSED